MRTRKIGIFYHSLSQRRPSGELRMCVYVGSYIRVDVIEGNDLGDALYLAAPDEDESVMNTHWLDGEPSA